MDLPVTIKDIARELGVTHATVSKALNGHPSVSEETREKVIRLARELDYRPNLVARSLSMRRSHMVGIIWHGIGATWRGHLAEHLHRVFLQRGYEALFSLNKPDKAAEIFSQQMLDWVVIGSSPKPEASERILAWRERTGIPLVSVTFTLDETVPSVDADRVAAIALGLAHLHRIGRRRAAIVCHQEQKLQGYLEEMARSGRPRRNEYIAYVPNSECGVAIDRMLDLAEPPDAIIAGDAKASVRIVHHLQVRGVGVPGDIAVLGYDEYPGYEGMDVELTTVGPSAEAMAEAVADLLLEPSRARMPVQHILVPPRLMIRESCGGDQTSA